MPDRSGHLSHEDRRAGRRRLPGVGELVRIRGNRHEQRAPRPARAAKRSSRPAKRATISRLCSTSPKRMGSIGATRSPEKVWDELPLAFAVACRHELRASRGARRHSVALYDETHPGEPSCTHALGRSGRRPARAVCRRRARPAGRGARRRVSAAPHDRPAAGFVQHRRAKRRLRVADAARRNVSTSRRRTRPIRSCEGDRVRVSSRRGSVVVPVRIDRGPACRTGLYDVPLQRRRRDELAHHRCNRSESGTAEFKACAVRIDRVLGSQVVDLHFTSATATRRSASAVDALLGSTGECERQCARRDRRILLLPALHAVQERIGWISGGALNYVCRAARRRARRRLRRRDVLRDVLDEARDRRASCTSATTSRASAAPATVRSARALRSARASEPTAASTWLRSPCLGLCDRAPAALVIEAGGAGRAPSRRRTPPTQPSQHRRRPAARNRSTTARRRLGSSAARARREIDPEEHRRRIARTGLCARCERPSSSARARRHSPRSPHRICWAAAAPRFRPGARWMRSRSGGACRTISSATPTNPNRARSKTAC